MNSETSLHFQQLAQRLNLPPRVLFAAIAYLAQSPTKKKPTPELGQFLRQNSAARELANLLMTPVESYALDELDKGLQAVWADEGEK